ncbi:hypothetical protein BCON_0024g00580 [Botryotinia convoluta]|uniref:Uncharacterized protein n=1 Tax=Botryotinia convoluta TaxID=54673 RepID=A0A4Z1IKD1_9HELO|nr:hypothetical protein BCON_0024g00580 [Botryotinia convoluta]
MPPAIERHSSSPSPPPPPSTARKRKRIDDESSLSIFDESRQLSNDNDRPEEERENYNDESEEEEEPIVRRSVGRPRKQIVRDSPEIPKRKVGRPKKIATSSAASRSSANADDGIQPLRNSATSTTSTIKKEERKVVPAQPPANDFDVDSQIDIQDEIERNLCEQPIFDDFWDSDDEESLLSDFGPRERLLKEISSGELGLWRKSLTLFKLSPWHLLPRGINVDTKNAQSLVPSVDINFEFDVDGAEDLLRKNWTNEFCSVFGNIILSQPFRNNLPFFRWTIRYVLFLRLGPKLGFLRPSKTEFGQQRFEQYVKFYKEKDNVSPHNEDPTKHALYKLLGPDLPAHFEFIQKLDTIVKKDSQDHKGLIKKDLDNIVKAWDLFVSENDNPRLVLKSVKDYSADWNTRGAAKKFNKYDNSRIPEMKKKWLVGLLRDHAKKQRRESLEEFPSAENRRHFDDDDDNADDDFQATPKATRLSLQSAKVPNPNGPPNFRLQQQGSPSVRLQQREHMKNPSQGESTRARANTPTQPMSRTPFFSEGSRLERNKNKAPQNTHSVARDSPELGTSGLIIEESPQRPSNFNIRDKDPSGSPSNSPSHASEGLGSPIPKAGESSLNESAGTNNNKSGSQRKDSSDSRHTVSSGLSIPSDLSEVS